MNRFALSKVLQSLLLLPGSILSVGVALWGGLAWLSHLFNGEMHAYTLPWLLAYVALPGCAHFLLWWLLLAGATPYSRRIGLSVVTLIVGGLGVIWGSLVLLDLMQRANSIGDKALILLCLFLPIAVGVFNWFCLAMALGERRKTE